MRNITIYSKDYCPYCKAAKRIFKERGWSFANIEVGFDSVLLAEMVERSGRRTVPQIFSDDGYIGGYDDLVRLLNGAEEQACVA